MKSINYVTYLTSHFTSQHPLYKSIYEYPPEGWRFDFLPKRTVAYGSPTINDIVEEKFARLPNREICFFKRFLETAYNFGANKNDIRAFLNTRLGGLCIPESPITFLPTFPFYIGCQNWTVAIEDWTTLFVPYIENGRSATIDLENHGITKCLRAALSLENFAALFTHMKSTVNTCRKLFPEAADRIYYLPLGLPQVEQINKNKNIVRFLVTGSHGGSAGNFYLRGAHVVLHAFQNLINQGYKALLTVQSNVIPEKINSPYITYYSGNQPDSFIFQLYKESDVVLIPAMRIHSITTTRAMIYSKPVICSDGWGFSEYVIHNYNGLVCEGQKQHAWEDDQGILREDYGQYNLVNKELVKSLTENMIKLIEDRELLQTMSANCFTYAQENFDIQKRNDILVDALDHYSYGQPSLL